MAKDGMEKYMIIMEMNYLNLKMAFGREKNIIKKEN